VTTIPLVLVVIFRARSSTSMFSMARSTSTSTGVAPVFQTSMTGDENVQQDEITSSPGPILSAENSRAKAAVAELTATHSALYGTDVCSRCGCGSARRLIGGTRCVSCYNREREFVRGRNRKGTRPTMAPLYARTVRYAVEGGAIETRTIDRSGHL
jgi:hypothetical protein